MWRGSVNTPKSYMYYGAHSGSNLGSISFRSLLLPHPWTIAFVFCSLLSKLNVLLIVTQAIFSRLVKCGIITWLLYGFQTVLTGSSNPSCPLDNVTSESLSWLSSCLYFYYLYTFLTLQFPWAIFSILSDVEGYQEDMTTGLAHELDPELGDSPPPPVLGMYLVPSFPGLQAARGHSLGIVMCWWDCLGWECEDLLGVNWIQ